MQTVSRVALLAMITLALPTCAMAEESASSSSYEYYRSGVGFKGANKFAPKYKERISNYHEQIQLGLTRGWLTEAQAEQFRAELARLAALEAEVAAKNFAQPGLDDLEKQMTKFNMDFSRAGSSPPPAMTGAETTDSATPESADQPAQPAIDTPSAAPPAPKPAVKKATPAPRTIKQASKSPQKAKKK